MSKLIALAGLLVLVEATEPYGHQDGAAHDYYTEPHYNFFYEVKDLHAHDIKSHKEERKGDHTQGVYSLIEPDGSKRTIEYHVAGKSGFNAIVHRENNKHPTVSHKSGFDHLAAGGFGGYSAGYKTAGNSAGEAATSFATHSNMASLGGTGDAYGGYHTVSYSSLGGIGGLQGSKNQEAPASATGGGYSDAGGAATSSVKFIAHGAHIDAITHHIIPVKHHH